MFGRHVTGTGHGGAVYTMKVGAKAATLVVAPAAGVDSHCTTPVWSPDGKWIAYTYTEDEDAYSYIYTIKPDGTGNQQVTFGRTSTSSRTGNRRGDDAGRPFWLFPLDHGVMQLTTTPSIEMNPVPSVNPANRRCGAAGQVGTA